MHLENRPVPVALYRSAFHAIFLPFPVVCFTLTLLTDVAYWRSSDLMWHNFSSWLLLAGLVSGALAVLAALLDLVLGRVRIVAPEGILWAVGSAVVLVLALLNSLVHAGDGWTAIVPDGLLLSAATVVLMIAVAWLGRTRYVVQHTELSYE